MSSKRQKNKTKNSPQEFRIRRTGGGHEYIKQNIKSQKKRESVEKNKRRGCKRERLGEYA